MQSQSGVYDMLAFLACVRIGCLQGTSATCEFARCAPAWELQSHRCAEKGLRSVKPAGATLQG